LAHAGLVECQIYRSAFVIVLTAPVDGLAVASPIRRLDL
jgi:hypothetical protein